MEDISNSLCVFKTEIKNRKKVKGDYIICINSKIKRDLKIMKYAVVTRTVIYSAEPIQLKLHGKVVVDNSLSNDQTKIDQTIRNAIGIPFDFEKKKEKTFFDIYPLRIYFIQYIKLLILKFFGIRYLFLRVCSSDVSDTEKDFVRIPKDSFEILGTDSGNKVVLESVIENKDKYVLKAISIKAYDLVPQILDDRKKKEEPRLKARYPDAEKILKVIPDIARIFIDEQRRKILGVNPLDIIKVRRNILDIFKKEILGFGIVFFISLLALAAILPIEIKTWLSFFMIGVSSLTVAIILVSLKIRSRIK